MLHIRGGVQHGCGTFASLVGVEAAGDSLLHSDDHASQHTSANRSQAKRSRKNIRKDTGKLLDVDQNDQQSTGNVERCHKGDNLTRHMRESLQAAGRNNKNQHRQDDTRVNGGNLEGILHHTANGVGLNKVTADDLNHHKNGTQEGKPRGVETIPDIVHGAAHPDSAVILLPIQHTQNDLAIFGSHTDECRDPHPEDRAQPARQNSSRDSNDISASNTRGDRHIQGLEG